MVVPPPEGARQLVSLSSLSSCYLDPPPLSPVISLRPSALVHFAPRSFCPLPRPYSHSILASVEINGTAMAYSPPHHHTIIGDASSFGLYADLPNCAILVLGFPCQPFAVH